MNRETIWYCANPQNGFIFIFFFHLRFGSLLCAVLIPQGHKLHTPILTLSTAVGGSNFAPQRVPPTAVHRFGQQQSSRSYNYKYRGLFRPSFDEDRRSGHDKDMASISIRRGKLAPSTRKKPAGAYGASDTNWRVGVDPPSFRVSRKKATLDYPPLSTAVSMRPWCIVLYQVYFKGPHRNVVLCL